jgi:hypothetical protein
MTQPQSSVSLFDARPFFEKALHYGLQHGLIHQEKLDAICTEAPKGMVQIARYFGNEFLRPDLEKARERIVNLVSLYLEDSCDGDLALAAESLRENSFLSRSKGGSEMLKKLLVMPQNSHFGMHESRSFSDDQIPLLAKWSLRSLADYRAELSARSQVAQVVDAALWLADDMGLQADELEEAGADAEAVIRSALLSLALGRTELPDWVAFEKLIAAMRKKAAAGKSATLAIPLPKNLPPSLRSVVEVARQTVLDDLPKMLDAGVTPRKLFNQTPAFMGRYFWLEDALSEVDHYDRSTSAAWEKATAGHNDDGSLLTLFLCVATGGVAKTLLTEKGAAALIRKVRKSGLKQELVLAYIREHAPAQHQDAYLQLWDAFLEESRSTLQSDADYELKDALALLRRECHVK